MGICRTVKMNNKNWSQGTSVMHDKNRHHRGIPGLNMVPNDWVRG